MVTSKDPPEKRAKNRAKIAQKRVSTQRLEIHVLMIGICLGFRI
jgi:hypothetical protein